jgi:hypothetical protein
LSLARVNFAVQWMLRTIFFPLMRRRVGKFPAMLLVFFLSAVMHELAVAVPLRMLRGWAFWGMFLQVRCHECVICLLLCYQV